MECRSCNFHNLPGQDHCGRCGARLAAPAGESFLPARPSRWTRFVRALRRAGTGHRRVTSRRTTTGPEPEGQGYRLRLLINPDLTQPWWRQSPLLAVLFSLLPGLGHLYLGQLRAGLFWLVGGMAAALLASRYLFTFVGSLALAGYCLAVTGAALTLVRRREIGFTWAGFGAAALLSVLVWSGATPVLISLNRLWDMRYATLALPVGPFAAGESLPFDRTAFRHRPPVPGEVVLTSDGRIDVVLAGPGDRLVCLDGELLLNGERRPDLHPFAYGGHPPDFDIVVPEPAYVVFPQIGGRGASDRQQFADLVLPLIFVHVSQIVGRYPGEVSWSPPVEHKTVD